jgi:hypothetical protein
MQDGQNYLGSGPLLLFHDVHGDPASVIADGAAVVRVNRHRNRVAVTCQGFVDRVVHDFVDKVMETARAS